LRRVAEPSAPEHRPKALEADGWKVGTAQEFLRLSDEESALIDLKLALGRALKERRTRQRLSQAAVAARIRSSQSRVAKMESGDSTVSIDLLVRTLFALGASRKDLANSLT
jgi:ribosome-binding protein aMBF1 (putative translation factor)